MARGHSVALPAQILFASEQIYQAERIVSFLQKRGFVVVVVDEFDPEYDWNAIDAIICVPGIVTQQLFEDLRTSDDRPLLVWVTDDLDEYLENNHSIADLILPNHPIYVEQQLEIMLSSQVNMNQIREQLDQQLKRREEIELLKNAIVRNVSHEMRTPLLQVKAAVSLITEEIGTVRLAEMATNAMTRLESNIQNVTMLGTSLDIELKPMFLPSAVESTIKSLERAKGSKDETNRIQLLIEKNLPPVLADKVGISTAIRLLIENALKFSDDNVDVIARKKGDHVYVAVQDYGIGIAEEKLKDIFDLFFQVDGSTTRHYGGMGIGLALVKLILEHHNCEIFVESEPGRGSIFYFFLEVADQNRLFS